MNQNGIERDIVSAGGEEWRRHYYTKNNAVITKAGIFVSSVPGHLMNAEVALGFATRYLNTEFDMASLVGTLERTGLVPEDKIIEFVKWFFNGTPQEE